MKNKQNALFKTIVLILITIISATHTFAQEETMVDVVIGCSKYVTDCASNAISLALEHNVMDEEHFSDYPEGYNPIAMGEIDPWEAYNALQAEKMDRAMAEEAQRAWQEHYEPQPDISDRVIKP